jgi:hypothetical protein
MLCGVTIIDLDRLPPAPPAPSPRDRLTRLGRRRLVTALAAVSLLGLLCVGGSAPDGMPRLEKVLTTPAMLDTGYTMAAGALFLATTEPRTELKRVSLDGGGTGWSRSFASPIEDVFAHPPGRLLVTTYSDVVATTMVDARSGATVWEHRDRLLIASSADVVLLAVLGAADKGVQALHAVSPESGAPVWSRTVDPDTTWHLDEAGAGRYPQYVVLTDPDGTTTTLRLRDGAVLATRELGTSSAYPDDETSDGETPPRVGEVSAVGDTLYVAQRSSGTTSLAAYRMADLLPRWRSEGAATGGVGPCGPMLCVEDQLTITVVDPATGRARWSTDQDRFLREGPGGHLLSMDVDEDPATTVLLDAYTGAVLSRSARLTPVYGSAGLFLRQDATAAARIFVTAADPRRPETGLRVLGRLDDATLGPCTAVATEPYIVCTSTSDTLTVWRVRP